MRPGPGIQIVFTSKAPTETFRGKSNRLEGRITVDPAALGDSVTVHLEADLAGLTTGLAKRDQHMRQNHLEITKYPKATFEGAAVLSPANGRLLHGQTTPIEIEGTFTIHGISRRLRAAGHVTYSESKGSSRIAFAARFPVSLADYQISRPQFLFLKLADTQQVEVKAVASTTP